MAPPSVHFDAARRQRAAPLIVYRSGQVRWRQPDHAATPEFPFVVVPAFILSAINEAVSRLCVHEGGEEEAA